MDPEPLPAGNRATPPPRPATRHGAGCPFGGSVLVRLRPLEDAARPILTVLAEPSDAEVYAAWASGADDVVAHPNDPMRLDVGNF